MLRGPSVVPSVGCEPVSSGGQDLGQCRGISARSEAGDTEARWGWLTRTQPRPMLTLIHVTPRPDPSQKPVPLEANVDIAWPWLGPLDTSGSVKQAQGQVTARDEQSSVVCFVRRQTKRINCGIQPVSECQRQSRRHAVPKSITWCCTGCCIAAA